MSGIWDSSQRRSAAEHPAQGSLCSSRQGWGCWAMEWGAGMGGARGGEVEGTGAGMLGYGVPGCMGCWDAGM